MSSKITPTSGKCSSCSNDGAPKVCSGCNAVLDASGTSKVPLTRYCNEACQKAHWLVHKPVCKVHQARKMLYRAGRIAQLAFYEYQEESWNHPPIESVDGSGGDLVVQEAPMNGQKGALSSFPHHLFKSEDEKLAVLTYLGCTDAVNHMYWLLHPMLQNICTSIEKVQIHTKPHQRLLIMKRPEGPDRTDVPHDILKATLKNGEIYALDIAGAQHGHYDSVTPWVKYDQLRIKKLKSSEEWQPIVPQPKVVYPELSWPDDAPFLPVFIDSVKEWQERNGRLENMLKVPGRPFRETRDELIRFLDGKLRDFRPRALEEEKRIRAEREKA